MVPVIPEGGLPRCLWCEREELNTGTSRICRHLAGDPTDRPGWFARQADRQLQMLGEHLERRRQG